MRIFDRLKGKGTKTPADVIDPDKIKAGSESMHVLTRIAELKDAGKDVYMKAERGGTAPVLMHVQEVDVLTFEEDIKKQGGPGFYRIYLVADDKLVMRPSDGKPEVYFLKIHGETAKSEKKREASEKSSIRETLEFAKEIMQLMGAGANAAMNPVQVFELVVKAKEALGSGVSELDTAEKAFGFMQKVMEATQRPPVTTGSDGGWIRALESLGQVVAPFAQGIMEQRGALPKASAPPALPQTGFAGAAPSTATQPGTQTRPASTTEQPQPAQAGQLEITHLQGLLEGDATPEEIAYYVLGDIRHYAERIPDQVPPAWINYQQDPDAAFDAFAGWYPPIRADQAVYDQIKAAGRQLMAKERELDAALEATEDEHAETPDSQPQSEEETEGPGSGPREPQPATDDEGKDTAGQDDGSKG